MLDIYERTSTEPNCSDPNSINNGYGITLSFVRACAMKVDREKKSHVRYAFGWNIYTMRIMGLWPQEKMYNPSENLKVFSAETLERIARAFSSPIEGDALTTSLEYSITL
ncbi:hypothetical protein HZH66_004387 [Vespula vulgaris]|uniref:Uncharacterized protein n=1 Tax=Vespula vulgaris TaxID=7454 RepID=A0A834KK01_VESVU|nr:hypothetical protein HZH66_004387 [Vespula vulgaris]